MSPSITSRIDNVRDEKGTKRKNRDAKKRRDKPAWSREWKSLTWKAVATHHGPESWRRVRKGTS